MGNDRRRALSEMTALDEEIAASVGDEWMTGQTADSSIVPDDEGLVEELRETAHAISQYDPENVGLGEQLSEAADRILALTSALAEQEVRELQTYYKLKCAERTLADERKRVGGLGKAVLAVVEATRAYLPPDGIDAQECLSRILAATDNADINPIIRSIENER